MRKQGCKCRKLLSSEKKLDLREKRDMELALFPLSDKSHLFFSVCLCWVNVLFLSGLSRDKKKTLMPRGQLIRQGGTTSILSVSP